VNIKANLLFHICADNFSEAEYLVNPLELTGSRFTITYPRGVRSRATAPGLEYGN
jgi:hypothetical protein